MPAANLHRQAITPVSSTHQIHSFGAAFSYSTPVAILTPSSFSVLLLCPLLPCDVLRCVVNTTGHGSHLFPCRPSCHWQDQTLLKADTALRSGTALLLGTGLSFPDSSSFPSSLSPAVTTWQRQRRVQFRWRRLSCLLAPACPAEALRGQLVLQGKQGR